MANVEKTSQSHNWLYRIPQRTVSRSIRSKKLYEKQNSFSLVAQNATVERHVAHLDDLYEPDRDRRATYQAICNWYEGNKQTNTTADIRVKLDNNFLSTKISASQFINKFKTDNQQLKGLGEAYTTSKVVSIFLEKITDPDYEHVVELCLAQNSTIKECIQQVRSKERRLDRNSSKPRRKPLSIRRTVGVEDEHKGKDNLGEEISEYITDNGYCSIPGNIWNKLDDDEKGKSSHIIRLCRRRGRSQMLNQINMLPNKGRRVHSL